MRSVRDDNDAALGGSGADRIFGLVVTGSEVFVAGQTGSTNLPVTAGGAQATYGGGLSDAFVARLSLSLTSLSQATYLGGAGPNDNALAAAVTGSEVFVAGYTNSADFPAMAGGAQASNGGGLDAFVARLSADLAGQPPAPCGNGVLDPGEQCDDGNTTSGDGCSGTCQVESCRTCSGTPSLCSPAPFGTPCDADHNLCTTDQCDEFGGCVPRNVICDQFHVTCVPISNVVTCSDDGDVCNGPESCEPATGQCVSGPALSCDDGIACTDDSCDPVAGCEHVPLNCDDGNVCTDDDCDPAAGCVHNDNSAPCDAGSACPQPDTCQLGTCIATKCVSGTVLPGGTVTTDTQGNGATPTEPVQTAVTSPADGTITITETAATGTPPTGFALVGEQVTVSAPAATPDVPLILAFLIDASRIPAGADETTIQIFKDGVLVPACAGAPGVASPDPCVSDRQLLAGGDVQITVLTSTASVWTFAVSTCGNGVLDPGEQCDDGNTVDGDGCSASCLSELIPGIGTPKRECVHEWLALSVPRRDHKGRPIRHVSCTDNNPTCDFGAVSGECTFHIGQCFNVTERRFACSATDVARVRLLSPRENKPRSSIDEANRDALEASLAGVGGVVRGQCTRPLSKRGQLCTVNADCDSAAGRGNGRCRGRFVAFAPALSAADSCTSFADIRVPLGRTEKLLLNAAPSAGRSDLNVLHLRCKP